MSDEPTILAALEAILEPLRAGKPTRTEEAQAAITKALKAHKGDFAALKPLAKAVPRIDRVLQICLELPEGAPLRRAAVALLARDASLAAPMLPLASEGRLPSRRVEALCLTHGLVYAAERKGAVSVWSLETGEHLTDLKSGAKVPLTIGETSAGGIRVVGIDGGVFEKEADAAKFKKVRTVGGGDLASSDGQWLVDLAPDYDSDDEATRVRIVDLESGDAKELNLPHRVDAAAGFVPGAGVAVLMTRTTIEWVDLRRGTHTPVPLPEGATPDGYTVESTGALNVKYTDAGSSRWARVAPGGGAPVVDVRATSASPWDVAARVRWARSIDWFPDGERFHARGTTAVHAADGTLICEYTPAADVNQLATAVDPISGRLVVAGRNVPMPVLVLAPYVA